MKPIFSRKTFLAVAIAAATGIFCQAQAQPAPSASGSSLPANIQPGSPLAEVVKLLQASVDVDTIRTFVANATGAFNLDADEIIFLKDEGLPSDVINAMMAHDKNFYAATQQAAPAPDATAPTTEVDTAPPAAPVTVEYFNDTLSPYGSWIDVDGYGRCWRPTTVIYDSGWRPYCDRGHWVATDCGWYWDSDYSWGVTFHYGRWFRDARFGWCWWPDTVWSSSWVTWRSSDDYCGWAPLPPFAIFQPGGGFFYRGAAVAAGFDFGLDAGFFMFVPVGNFCDRHPRSFCVAAPQAAQIFRRAAVVNNFSVNNRFVANTGIPVQRFNTLAHLDIHPVSVGEVRNAQHQGWRGTVPNPGVRDVNANRQPGYNPSSPVRNQIRNDTAPTRPPTPVRPENHSANWDYGTPANTHSSLNPPANNVRAQSQPAFNDTPRPNGSPFNTAPAERQHQATQLTIPTPAPVQEPRVENRQSSVEAAPRNFAPAAPAPSQPQTPPPPAQNSQHGQEKDKQNH